MVFNELSKFLTAGDLIALVGAGASVPIHPDWQTLLTEFLESAKSEGLLQDKKDIQYLSEKVISDPLEAAGAIEELFGREVFREKLASKFRLHADDWTEAHELILKLSTKGIVTLNYDSCLERAFVSVRNGLPEILRSQDPSELTRWVQSEQFTSKRFPILHLHGVPSDPENIIFTSDDYNKFYSKDTNQTFVRSLWCSDRMVIIGFGFGDPFFGRVAEQTLRDLPTNNRHFALIGHKSEDGVSSLMRKQFS
jgi:hypothetical protein